MSGDILTWIARRHQPLLDQIDQQEPEERERLHHLVDLLLEVWYWRKLAPWGLFLLHMAACPLVVVLWYRLVAGRNDSLFVWGSCLALCAIWGIASAWASWYRVSISKPRRQAQEALYYRLFDRAYQASLTRLQLLDPKFVRAVRKDLRQIHHSLAP